ncbi:MAG TPA: hypothetical protein VEB21_04480, partial [Terriglobales bacterium]|nr:hypothetical protein [Terriglobales bacterium]
MPTLRMRRALTIGILLLTFSGGCSDCGSSSQEQRRAEGVATAAQAGATSPTAVHTAGAAPGAAPAPDAAAAPAAAAPTAPAAAAGAPPPIGAPTIISSPTPGGPGSQTPSPQAAMPTAPPVIDAAAAERCKEAVQALANGDAAALQVLPPAQRDGLQNDPLVWRMLTCLAAADNNARICDSLPGDNKEACVGQVELSQELKAEPSDTPEGFKAVILHRACRQFAPQAGCEGVREAIKTNDSSKCSGVGAGVFRNLCEAISAADPQKCDGIEAEDARALCTALASNDASRCIANDDYCKTLVGGAAAIKDRGLAGLQNFDPTIAAARKGREACAPMLALLNAY